MFSKSLSAFRASPFGAGLVLAVLCGSGLLPAGCQQEPKTYPIGELNTPQIMPEAGDYYWRRNRVPKLDAQQGARVAVLDFTVEFVTSMAEAPARVVLPGDDKKEKPEEVARRLAKLSRKRNVYPPGFYDQLTGELYAMTVRELEGHSRHVLSAETVRSSRAYQLFKATEPFQIVQLGQGNRGDPDIPYPEQVVAWPAQRLGILKGTHRGTMEQVTIEVLEELGADVAVRARFRVSVFRGRAVLDRGSQVWVLSRRVLGDMILAKPLVSAESVLLEDEFRIARADVNKVDGEKYLNVMRRLFPKLIELGFASGGTH